MNLRPAISVPLPWLIILFGKVFGKKGVEPRSRKRLFKFPRSLSVTREGKWFIGILLFIGVAAINTGNNLLYLVVATLLSLIVISGIMSESTIRAVTVERTLPKRVFKNTPVVARLKATNGKRIFPSFSFSVREILDESVRAESAYFLKLEPEAEATKTAKYTFRERGLHTLTAFKVETRFPFGLFLKGREEASLQEVLVYPSTMLKSKPTLLQADSASGADRARGKGSGAQLWGLRDYTFADDARHIHWRSAARTGKLLVKEFERESEKKAVIVFENLSSKRKNAFEDAVDEAASYAGYLLKEGYAVGLKTLSNEIAPRAGKDQLERILYSLALISPAESKGTPAVKVISS
ncbi:MAG: DUF58 domain-containing protein [Deltaproteobacteria bacterium]|nr:DUF58 domain-containing protein [Deltaproteobacteria bacterium]